MRAQNDFLRPASALDLGLGAGALRLLPVARLYLARPLAVRPAPAFTDCFSPLPTDKLTDLRAIYAPSHELCMALPPSYAVIRRGFSRYSRLATG